MIKYILSLVLGFAILGISSAQNVKLYPDFLHETPGCVFSLLQLRDGNYLISGEFDRINGIRTGNFTKIDKNGDRVDAFESSNVQDRAKKIVELPDGKILVGGWFYRFNDTRGSLARLNADGTLDNSFQPFIIQEDLGLTWLHSFDVQSDGKIIVIARIESSSPKACVRLNANGTVDDSFVVPEKDYSTLYVDENDNVWLGADHLYKFSKDGDLLSGFPVILKGAIHDINKFENKLLITGTLSEVGGQARKGLAYVNTDGTVDPAFFEPGNSFTCVVNTHGHIAISRPHDSFRVFDAEGNQLMSFDPSGSHLMEIFADSEGNFLVSTGFKLSLSPSDHIPMFRRFTAALVEDQTFSCKHTLTSAGPISVYPDGTIAAVAAVTSGGPEQVRMIRPDKSEDPDFELDPAFQGKVGRIADIFPDGSLLLIAESSVKKISVSGEVDASFHSPEFQFDPLPYSTISGVRIRSDGIYITGRITGADGFSSNGLLKLKLDGTVDQSLQFQWEVADFDFLSDNTLLTAGEADGMIKYAVIDADGSVLREFNGPKGTVFTIDSKDRIYTHSSDNAFESPEIERYHSDGLKDESFSVQWPDKHYGFLTTVEVLDGDRIFVGKATDYNDYSFYIFNEDGTLTQSCYEDFGVYGSINSAFFNGESLFLTGKIQSLSDPTMFSGIAAIHLFSAAGNLENLTVTLSAETSATLQWENALQHCTAIVVERAVDDGSFVKLAQLAKSSMSFEDNTLEGEHSYRYRVRGINTHSETNYSNIAEISTIALSVDGEATRNVFAFPNPGTGIFEITIPAEFQPGAYGIVSPVGKPLGSQPVNAANGKITLDLTAYPPGIYFLTISHGTSRTTLKVIKL